MTLLLPLALWVQQATQPSPPLSVDLPAGINRELSTLVFRIMEAGAAGRYKEAEALVPLLPKREIVLGWNDSKVPKALKSMFLAGRDEAVEMFQKRAPELKITFASRSTQLQFSFEPVLATRPGSSVPAGATSFFSESAGEPRVETVIGLKRGSQLAEATENDVYAEVAYGIGSYLGLCSPSYNNSFMSRSDQPWSVKLFLPGQEAYVVEAIQKISDQIRSAVAKHEPMVDVRPQLKITPQEVDGGEIFQGEPVPLSFQLSNLGTGPLSFMVKGDCGCVAIQASDVVPPSGTMLVSGVIDTREVRGEFQKNVLVMTNDPEHPLLSFPVRVKSKPRFNIDSSVGGATTAADDGSARFEANIRFEKGAKPFTVKQAAVTGLQGKASFAPMKSATGDVEGYHFFVKIDSVPSNGRFAAQLNVLTDDANFRVIERTVFVQRGIVCVPPELFVGDLGTEKRVFKAEILRPKRPFKILATESTIPAFKATLEDMPGLGKRLVLKYDGQPGAGILSGRVVIRTDDKLQPEIEIPVSGNFVK